MLLQSQLVNVYPSLTGSPVNVFDSFMSTFGVDGEYRVGIEQPHLLLTMATSPGVHPLQGKPDVDWLGTYPSLSMLRLWTKVCFPEAKYSDSALRSMVRVLDQSPPVYPSLESNVLVNNSERLQNLLEPASRWNYILHFQCSEDTTKSISEQCRNFLDQKKRTWQFIHYFCFNAQDIRYNSLRPMFNSIFAHTSFSRISTIDTQFSIGAIGGD